MGLPLALGDLHVRENGREGGFLRGAGVHAEADGIGYTPFFYCTAMVRDLMRVDMLSIDGVAPTKESLRSNKYPFVSSIYAAVRKTEDHESMAYKLYQFLFTKKGADMIDESGYIACPRSREET